MTKEEVKHICESAGTKITYEFRFRWPFIHKIVWEFRGNCGCCGKQNWQWTTPVGWGWTYACKECCEGCE